MNCSHLDKEADWDRLGLFLQKIYPFCHILIDLQGPKPRIYSFIAELNDKVSVAIGDQFRVSYAENDDANRLCTADHLKVCFPEIVSAMEVGNMVVFDDGKMTAVVREIDGNERIIECVDLAGKDSYQLKGRKGICVRNKPLGIDCITQYDRECIEFARDKVGYDSIDSVMVSYFTSSQHILDFQHILRQEY